MFLDGSVERNIEIRQFFVVQGKSLDQKELVEPYTLVFAL